MDNSSENYAIIGKLISFGLIYFSIYFLAYLYYFLKKLRKAYLE